MQILYKIYSKDLEIKNTKCVLVMQNDSEEDQIFPSIYSVFGPFSNRNQIVGFIVCIHFVGTATKYSINKYVWADCSLEKN